MSIWDECLLLFTDICDICSHFIAVSVFFDLILANVPLCVLKWSTVPFLTTAHSPYVLVTTLVLVANWTVSGKSKVKPHFSLLCFRCTSFLARTWRPPRLHLLLFLRLELGSCMWESLKERFCLQRLHGRSRRCSSAWHGQYWERGRKLKVHTEKPTGQIVHGLMRLMALLMFYNVFPYWKDKI